VAKLLYLNYLIVTSSQFDHVKGYWDCWASVQWHLDDTWRSKILNGPANRFKAKDEAEQFGFEMGKDWVDKRSKLH
jgi:hypothetical protein